MLGLPETAMESLWYLEDKWKLSTQGAVLLLLCATFLVMGVCIATVLKRSWGGSVKRVLMATVRWSGASKWEEQNVASWQEGLSPSPLLDSGKEGPVSTVGWQSLNSESPVWQRPILMGEKCEMPRFSGLILYDERGQPLNNEPAFISEIKQDKSPAKGRTTLRDLL